MPQLAAVCVNDRVSGQLQTFDEGRGIAADNGKHAAWAESDDGGNET
jgi:hypothetical protein